MPHTQTLIWLYIYYEVRDHMAQVVRKQAQNQEQAYQKLSAHGIIREITSVFNVWWSYIRGTPVVVVFIIAFNNAIYGW